MRSTTAISGLGRASNCFQLFLHVQRAGSLAVLVMNINSGPIAGFQCWIIETGAIKGFQRLVGIAEGALIVAFFLMGAAVLRMH